MWILLAEAALGGVEFEIAVPRAEWGKPSPQTEYVAPRACLLEHEVPQESRGPGLCWEGA